MQNVQNRNFICKIRAFGDFIPVYFPLFPCLYFSTALCRSFMHIFFNIQNGEFYTEIPVQNFLRFF